MTRTGKQGSFNSEDELPPEFRVRGVLVRRTDDSLDIDTGRRTSVILRTIVSVLLYAIALDGIRHMIVFAARDPWGTTIDVAITASFPLLPLFIELQVHGEMLATKYRFTRAGDIVTAAFGKATGRVVSVTITRRETMSADWVRHGVTIVVETSNGDAAVARVEWFWNAADAELLKRAIDEFISGR
jgi:hypothetical protein